MDQMVSVGDILSDDEIVEAMTVWAYEKDGPNLNQALVEKVIMPILPRINKALGMKCDPKGVAALVGWTLRTIHDGAEGQETFFSLGWNAQRLKE